MIKPSRTNGVWYLSPIRVLEPGIFRSVGAYVNDSQWQFGWLSKADLINLDGI